MFPGIYWKKVFQFFVTILDLAPSKKLLNSYPVLKIAETMLGMVSFNLTLTLTVKCHGIF